jgi:hypothetical protein
MSDLGQNRSQGGSSLGLSIASLRGIIQKKLRASKKLMFGMFYMVSGIYSIGFGLTMVGDLRPVNGNPAYVPTPDGLFWFEIAIFAVFGIAFMGAALAHITSSMHEFGKKETLRR